MNIDPEINQRRLQAIRPLNIGTILHPLTGNRVGEDRRDLQQIIAVAEEWSADVRVVAAAFGFLAICTSRISFATYSRRIVCRPTPLRFWTTARKFALVLARNHRLRWAGAKRVRRCYVTHRATGK